MTEKNRVNKKCYANRGGNKCRILVSNKCPGMKCSFFRTGEQHKESCERSKVRLQNLDTFEQQYIADKYYGGKKVWLKGD
ncbi:MAG: hypothetical protein AB9888_08235 [Bacteroidales bacterium]